MIELEWWQITLYMVIGLVIGFRILWDYSRSNYLDAGDVGGILVVSVFAWPFLGILFGAIVVLNRIANYFNER